MAPNTTFNGSLGIDLPEATFSYEGPDPLFPGTEPREISTDSRPDIVGDLTTGGRRLHQASRSPANLIPADVGALPLLSLLSLFEYVL